MRQYQYMLPPRSTDANRHLIHRWLCSSIRSEKLCARALALDRTSKLHGQYYIRQNSSRRSSKIGHPYPLLYLTITLLTTYNAFCSGDVFQEAVRPQTSELCCFRERPTNRRRRRNIATLAVNEMPMGTGKSPRSPQVQVAILKVESASGLVAGAPSGQGSAPRVGCR